MRQDFNILERTQKATRIRSSKDQEDDSLGLSLEDFVQGRFSIKDKVQHLLQKKQSVPVKSDPRKKLSLTALVKQPTEFISGPMLERGMNVRSDPHNQVQIDNSKKENPNAFCKIGSHGGDIDNSPATPRSCGSNISIGEIGVTKTRVKRRGDQYPATDP